MTLAEMVRWLRNEAHLLDGMRERVGRGAEGPGWEDDRHRSSRRHRQTLYRLADALDAAHEAALGALDTFDPEWDDKPEPIHDDPARTDYVRGKLHGCVCAWDHDLGIHTVASTCPIHGVDAVTARAEQTGAWKPGVTAGQVMMMVIREATPSRPADTPEDCIGTEWLPNGQCDDLKCEVHYSDLDRSTGIPEYRHPDRASDRRGRGG